MNGATTMNLKSFWATFLLFCLFLLVGCSGDDTAGGGSDIGNPGPVGVVSFNDASELESYLKKEFAGSVISTDIIQGDDIAVAGPDPAQPVDPGDSASDSDSLENSDYSTTNIQEAGVDEADKVKTDGEYFYIAKGQTVKIARAVPANNMEVLQTLDINGTVDSLYLYNNTLTVIYTPLGYGGNDWPYIDPIMPAVDVAFFGMPYWLPVQAIS